MSLSGCYTATWPRFCVETMYTDDFLSRNTPSDQKRNPHPNVTNQSAYSASPSQLTLGGDLHSAGLPNPYQTNPYAYIQSPHDPTGGLMSAPGDLDTTGLGVHTQQTLPSPTVKKGRTNTPWTPAEEQRLKTLRDAGSSWSEIAKTFPTRTEGSVKKHWYKDMHYAEFAEDEVSNFVRLTASVSDVTIVLTSEQSAALLQAIKDYENNKWKVIGQKVGKPAKACEQFAKEQGWKV
ncbi:hypothetical protein HII31_08224 [Pseudocercospora fuligena]|uniref:Myb-like domain-containing protein n=1 Tax=Pseudocercospora fuligena TaxID=685502 RepID=A0A8H6VGF2_9PEZI|nr:hypothetical protein HII31_08224 [Pseudocercospora fuligena]